MCAFGINLATVTSTEISLLASELPGLFFFFGGTQFIQCLTSDALMYFTVKTGAFQENLKK